MLNMLDPYRWAAAAAVAVAVALSGSFFAYRYSLIKQGAADQIAKQTEVNLEALRERNKEISRLVGVTRILQEAHDVQIQKITALQLAADADAERMQQLTTVRRSTVATTANIPALRIHATTAGDVYEQCRKEYRSLGFEIEKVADGSRTLKGYVDAVTVPANPLSSLSNMFSNQPEK